MNGLKKQRAKSQSSIHQYRAFPYKFRNFSASQEIRIVAKRLSHLLQKASTRSKQ
jgi:hypothetical protein